MVRTLRITITGAAAESEPWVSDESYTLSSLYLSLSLPADTGSCTPRRRCSPSDTPSTPLACICTRTSQGPTAGKTENVCIISQLSLLADLIILHEALAPGSGVRASAPTGSVVKLLLERMRWSPSDPCHLLGAHLLGAALELLAAAGAAGVDLETEAGAHLLQPGLPRHRGLVHHLHAGVGHTLGHAPAGAEWAYLQWWDCVPHLW